MRSAIGFVATLLVPLLALVVNPFVEVFRAAMRAVSDGAPSLPRLIRFAQHPFVKKGHAKILAGGSALRALMAFVMRPALAMAFVFVLLLASSGVVHHSALLAAGIGQTVDVSELKTLIENQGKLFDQFKAANDQRIKELEKSGSASADAVATVENLNKALTDVQAQIREIEIKAARPAFNKEGKEVDPNVKAHMDGFNKFLRKGVEDGLRDLEVKAAVNITTDADGAYAVPTELDKQVYALEVLTSPLLGAVQVITTSTGDYKKIVDTKGVTSGWVDEDDARAETNSGVLAAIAPFMGEVYSFPFSTQQALEDIFFNVEEWLTGSVAEKHGVDIGAAIVSGNGTKKPKGFTAYTLATTADGTRAFGQIQKIKTGAAATLGATPFDVLIDMQMALKPKHRGQAAWAMNATTLASLRKERDGDDNYIWQPSVVAGQPSTLLGAPVLEVADMADIGAAALPIAFANWKAAYLLARRVGFSVLRDPFTNKPYVGFYCRQRVGGAVMDSEAIKLASCEV